MRWGGGINKTYQEYIFTHLSFTEKQLNYKDTSTMGVSGGEGGVAEGGGKAGPKSEP